MASSKVSSSNELEASIRPTADMIISRANTIKVPSTMERATQLARLILKEAPQFGAHELRDEKIQQVLKRDGIGLAVFRKALSQVRKEIVKKPRSTKRSAIKTDAAPVIQRSINAQSEATPKFVENTPPNLL